MLSISGFGSSGPYVDAKVYDPVVQAMIGAGQVNPNSDGTPTTIHNLICDKVR
jgi:crotonobetainyl-CoA:carnitine CoA-transferase CaiB-like acyl-CoA transferase